MHCAYKEIGTALRVGQEVEQEEDLDTRWDGLCERQLGEEDEDDVSLWWW